MTKTTKAKRGEAQARAGSISTAEAITTGTVAGGLVLGILQAKDAGASQTVAPSEAESDARGWPDEVASEVSSEREERPSSEADGVNPVQIADDRPVDPNATHATAAPVEAEAMPVAVPQPMQAQTAPVSAREAAPEMAGNGAEPSSASTAQGGGGAIVPASAEEVIAAPSSDISARLTDQLASSLERMADGIAAGEPVAGLSREIAEQISSAVQDMARQIDLGPLPALGAADGILAEIPTVDAILAGIPNAAEIASTLPDIGDIGAQLTEGLGGLSATLLGADADETPAGLMETLFYRDGNSEMSEMIVAPAAPVASIETLIADAPSIAADDVLSDIGGMMPDVALLQIGLIGQSYMDVADGNNSPLVNALHLA